MELLGTDFMPATFDLSVFEIPTQPALEFLGIMGGVLVIHDVEWVAPTIGQLEEASISTPPQVG